LRARSVTVALIVAAPKGVNAIARHIDSLGSRPYVAAALRLTISILVLAALTAAGARADDEATPAPAELPPVVVSGSPLDPFETSADVTGSTQVIDAHEAWRGYENVGDLLERGVGVQVRHFGARDDFQTISIRGSTPNQVKILLDGVSVSRAQSDVVNLADLPMDAVERIEVYRGFVPVRYASSGAASVINIVTRKDAPGTWGASASYGSFDTAKATLHAGESVGGGDASAFLTYRRSDGDFKFKDDTPDPETNPSGQTVTRRRINNDFESWDTTLRWTRPVLGDGTLTLTGNGYYKDEGTPGPANNQAPLARFSAGRGIFSAALDTGNGTNVSADLTVLEESVRDPKDPANENPGLGRPPKEDNTTVAFSAGASRTLALGEWQLLEGSAEAAYEHFDGRFSGIDDPLPQRTQQRARVAFALGDDVYVDKLRTVLSPQLRLENVWNFFEGEALFPPIPEDDLPNEYDNSVDPRLGVRVEPISTLALKGNIGTYFRPPNFGELFGDDGFSTANPALDPENGVNRDVGLLWRPIAPRPLRDVAFEYIYFDNDIEDMIVFIPAGNRIPRPQNVGKTHVSGHELRLEAGGPVGLSFSSNYTHQDAENRTGFPEFRGKDVPSLPRDELYARLAVDRDRWSLAYEMDYRSDVFLDQANLLEPSPAHTTHSLTLALRHPRSGFTLTLEGQNLGDEQVQDVVG
jgi:iron complex outermembrane receptor protein